jgi:proteic killer suppression protein
MLSMLGETGVGSKYERLTPNDQKLTLLQVIASYGDEATRDVHHGQNTKEARTIPKNLWDVVIRKLNQLEAMTRLGDLTGPGNSLERLKYDLEGWWGMRVNRGWRVIFVFKDGRASLVQVLNYHKG